MPDPNSQIGTQIRQRRNQLGWSLDASATATGVSKAMLGQIERGESSPTVGVLWKIATGLEMSYSTLLGGAGKSANKRLFHPDTANSIYDDDGIEAYTLIPFSPAMGFELMVVTLAPNSTHVSTPHAPGVVEHVIVLTGSVEIRLKERWSPVAIGEVLRFPADQPHAYRNPNDAKATFHDLIRYT